MVTFVTFREIALIPAAMCTPVPIGVFGTFEEAAKHAMAKTAEEGHLMAVAKVIAITEREEPVAPKVSIVNVCDIGGRK